MTTGINDSLHQAYVLAYVDDSPRTVMLLRMARRRAAALGIPWVALCIEPVKQNTKPNDDIQLRLMQNMTLAEQMGASAVTVRSDAPFDGVRDYIIAQSGKGQRVEALYIGEYRSAQRRWWHSRSLSSALARAFGGATDVIVVPLEAGARVSQPWWRTGVWARVTFNEILLAILAVLVATLLIEIITYAIPEALTPNARNKAVIYMAACAFAASRYGLVPGLVAAVFSFASFNYLYVVPYDSFIITDAADVLNLTLFLIATLVLSVFCSSSHEQADQLMLRTAQLQALSRMNRVALRRHTRGRTLEALSREIKAVLGADVVFFLPTAATPLQLTYTFPGNVALSDTERTALRICWDEARVTGCGSLTFPDSTYRFKPLLGSSDVIGVMGIHCTSDSPLDADAAQMFAAVADLVALILERVELTQMTEESRVREEREKLRSMLLSSVSHDLKTPLASVIGGLSVIRSMGSSLSEEQRTELVSNALEEAQRLDSFITNILDMTRLESGQTQFKKEWSAPQDLLANVLRRRREWRERFELLISDTADKSLEISVDPVVTEQVIFNILDNAIKYAKSGSQVSIDWAASPDGLDIFIRDNGPGIPPDQLEKVFDKYARIQQRDSKVAGTGLGLAISRAIMQAQGGTITADNHPEGGAVFRLRFPVWRTTTGSTQQKVAS
ncbi:MAG: ATP-binding protein [Bdellovibrionales bacterium]